MFPNDDFEVPSCNVAASEEGDRLGVAQRCRRELTLLLATLSMILSSCAGPKIKSGDSEMDEALLKDGIEQAEKPSPSKREGGKEKRGLDSDDVDLEDESQEGMDEIEKCLDITMGDERRAFDPKYIPGPGQKKPMSKKKVSRRCVSI